MNVKLKKRMTGTFEDLELGDTFVYHERVYLKVDRANVGGLFYEAVGLDDGCFESFGYDTEVEVIHGTFVEDGAE